MGFRLRFASDLRSERSALPEARTALCELLAAQDQILIRRPLLLPYLHHLLFCHAVQYQKHSSTHGALLPLPSPQM